MLALIIRAVCICILAVLASGSIAGMILLLLPSRSIQVRKFDVLGGSDLKKDTAAIISQLVTVRIQQIDSVLTKDLTSRVHSDQVVRIESVIPAQLRLSPQVQNQIDVEFKAFDFDIAGILNTIMDQLHQGPALHGVIMTRENGTEILANYRQENSDPLGPWAIRSTVGTGDAVELLAHSVVLDFHRQHSGQFGTMSVDQFRSLISSLKEYQDYFLEAAPQESTSQVHSSNLHLDRAEKGFKELATLESDCSLVYSYLGSIATIRKNAGDAQQNFKTAFALDPADDFSKRAFEKVSAVASLQPPPAEGPGSLKEVRQQPAFKLMHIEEATRLAGSLEVPVAVLADGATRLPGFRLAPGKAFIGEEQNLDASHGTQVTSIIAAIAPTAKVIPVTIFGKEGVGDIASAIQGIGYAKDVHSRIIVLPFSSSLNSKAMEQVIRGAIESGILVIAAAGNESSEQEQYPAAFHEVFSVAAVDLTDKRASFSNFGPSVKAVAPGVNILTLDPTGRIQRLTGTSASCAEAAGIAALVVSTNPSLTGQEVSKILLETTTPISDKGLGTGRLDAAAAVMKAKVPSKE